LRRAPNNDLYDFPSERTKGIIGTIIFHVILISILVITGFHTPLPLPEEEGILVNFGYDDTGSGMLEPVSSSSSLDPVPAEQSEEIIDEVPVEESTLTQEFEDAPVVEKTVEQPDPEEERKKQEEAEAERIRQQQLEEERVRKEAEEIERKRLEEEQQRRDVIINRTRNALNNANATGTNENTSEGEAGGEGNQGVVTGSVDSEKYGEGTGTGTEGVSFDLAGRQAMTLPKPKYDVQSEGIVVVEVTVDRDGNVTNAIAGVQGSTTLEDYFLRVAREAARATKFDSKPDALIQKGTITYHFKLR